MNIQTVLAAMLAAVAASAADPLADGFTTPPAEARPWVWAHWMEGNVDKASITRNLEAMQRVGIGGLTLFDIGENTFDKDHNGMPPGPHDYLSPSWREMFEFEIAEAARLGLQTMSLAGPGWCGNGGPWITPELAAQKVVHSETRVKGGKRFQGKLPQPEANGGFYRDIAVFAVRESDKQRKFRIEDFDFKRVQWLNYVRWRGTRSAALDAKAPAGMSIAAKDTINVTAKMKPDGAIVWDAPPGEWTLLRFGHTWTGQKTFPSPKGGEGPECDKLDPRGVRAHFEHLQKPLAALGEAHTGREFIAWFLDSWEGGGQNWTEQMPAEFQRRRGYDLIPYLPVLAGRVLNDLQTTERFLFDLRLTVSELITENFWAEIRRLTNAQGMKLAAQVYITPGNDFDAANHVDEPMGECWAFPFQPNDYRLSVKAASDAATLNSRAIVGVEAFTGTTADRWQTHPATLKALADVIFSLGGNRMQVHCFAMQRFPQLRPGMMMGKWGTHYDATQTWWEWTRPWHDYLARCQFLLRQGRVVADVLVAAPEEPLHRYEAIDLPGFNTITCGPDTFQRLAVENGRVTVPGGPSFPLLVVRHHGTMSLARARKIGDLVKAGARILAEPPAATPGLSGFPRCDEELRTLAANLWSPESSAAPSGGRLFRGIGERDALAQLGVAPDFTSDVPLSWLHRATGTEEIYFLASAASNAVTASCTFRIAGMRAEIWDAETGERHALTTTAAAPGRTTAVVPLRPTGSAFVVFRSADTPPSASVSTPDLAAAATSTAPVAGPWRLVFPADSGVTAPVVLDALTSWSDHADSAVRHFSGTATYSNRFELADTKGRVELDLGRVEVMARVRVNHVDLGILWKPPYLVDISNAVRAGMNELEIDVVNLWPNRLIGDAALPEDSPRNANGRLEAWPDWVLEGKSSPTGRRSFVTLPLWKPGESLLPSGILGPVEIRRSE